MNKDVGRKLVASTLIAGGIFASAPMTGCEPATTAAAVAVVTVTLQQLVKLAAQSVVVYLVQKVGEEIYIRLVQAIDGEQKEYRVVLKPGEVLEFRHDGTAILR